MDKVINLSTEKEIREAARNTIPTDQSETKGIFENLLKEIENINPSLGGFDELSALLSLPEDQFMIIAPVFVDELEKSMNNVTDITMLAQSLNASGLKLEDLKAEFDMVYEEIDRQMDGIISAQKRDFLKQVMAITYNCIAKGESIARRTIQIPIEYCDDRAKMPAYAKAGDAGMDVFALEDITIKPGETKLIPLGIKVAIPRGFELQVRPKSGRSLKSKLRIANTPGTIDSGYRDEVGVIIENIESPIKGYNGMLDGEPVFDYGQSYTIGAGEKFAQLVLSEVPIAAFYKVDTVSSIGENRGGGFGSTGTK